MEFKGVNLNKVEAVFRACMSSNSVTRSGIAENTGMSIMTVGKIVDMLAEAGVLSQQMPRRNCAGRRTRVIRPKGDLRIAVYSLTDSEFSLHLLDLSLKEKGVFKYLPESRVLIEDEIIRFYEDSYSFIAANTKPSKFIGTGILIPGKFNKETGIANLSLGNDKLMSRVYIPEYGEAFPGNRLIVSDNNTSTLKYFSKIYEKGTSVLVVFINSVLECSYIRAGDPSERFRVGRCGTLPFFADVTINDKLRQSDSPEMQAEIIARLIVTLVACVAPEKLILTGSKYNNMDIFTGLIKQKVLYLCESNGLTAPDVVSKRKEHNPVKAISSEIRDLWFYKEILENH